MKIILSFTLLFILSFLVSCKKFLDIPEPKTQVTTDKVFSNNDAAIAAASGLYSEMGRANLSICNGGQTLYAGLAADELYTTSPNEDADAFYNNSIPPTNTTGLPRLWNQAYKNIYQANAVMEGLQNSSVLADSIVKRLKAEMLVARAFNHFYLVNLFGAAPLMVSTDYRANSVAARTVISDMYQQIVSDLTDAKNLLPVNYNGANRARPNKWAATALLARVYLYQENWVKAEEEASAVIQSGLYSINSILNNVFLPASTETIWQLVRDNNNTADGVTFIPSSTTVKPMYAISSYLLSAFSSNDQRKANWTKQNTIGGQAYYYPYKYKVRTATPISEYYIMLRLAEQFLIRAEARAQQNNITGARDDLNVIRQRAGLANNASTDKSSLLSAIEQERQTELFAEWGHRWFDLKRLGHADPLLSVVKSPNWQTTDKLFPIPQTEIDTNPFLVQNPGY